MAASLSSQGSISSHVVRSYDPGSAQDKAALFRVCLETGDSGADATQQYPADPDALGLRWVGPYLDLEPQLAFALEEPASSAVHGYALGCLDTNSFMERLEASYLPPLRADARFALEAFASKPRAEWSAEQEVYFEFHAIPEPPPFVVAKYPSHLHIDLTAEAQGAGNGRRMMGALLAKMRLAGSPGVHLEMHSANARARRFYERLGFHEVARVLDAFDAGDSTSKRHILSGEGYGQFIPRTEPAAGAPPSLERVLRDGTPHIVYMAMVFRPRGEPTDWRPVPTYGRNLLDDGDDDRGRAMAACKANAIVLTAPEPWALVKHHFGVADPSAPPDAPPPPGVHFVTSMDHDKAVATTEALVQQVRAKLMGRVTAVFGIGGGSACDHAKFVVEKVNEIYDREDGSAGSSAASSAAPLVPLVLVPTILSVDAPYTRAAGVRETGKVRYVGNARPFLEGGGALLVDFGLLQAAPPSLNRAGVGDLLSIFTALRDWRQAAARQGEGYDPDIAARAAHALGRLVKGADEIRLNSEAGLRLLSELYVEEVALCEQWGDSRPEEGSEHYLAYCVEDTAKRGGFVHGQLVGLCAVAVARFQEISGCAGCEAIASEPLLQGYTGSSSGSPTEASGSKVFDARDLAAFLKRVGLECSYEAAQVPRETLRAALLRAGSFCRSETQLLPGVFSFVGGVPEDQVDSLLSFVEEVLAQ